MSEPSTPATSSKAMASLILGILGFACVLPVVGSLAAVILGHMAKAEIRRSDGQLGGSGAATGGLLMGYFGLLAVPAIALVSVAMVVPTLDRAREQSVVMQTHSHLSMFGLAMLMYSGDNAGALPTDIAELYDGDYLINGQFWVVPGSGTVAPSSAADIRAGQIDYVYLGAGLQDDAADPHRLVVLYTKPGLLPGGQISAVFLDGHIETVVADSIDAAATESFWILPSGEPEPEPEPADE